MLLAADDGQRESVRRLDGLLTVGFRAASSSAVDQTILNYQLTVISSFGTIC